MALIPEPPAPTKCTLRRSSGMKTEWSGSITRAHFQGSLGWAGSHSKLGRQTWRLAECLANQVDKIFGTTSRPDAGGGDAHAGKAMRVSKNFG